MLHILEHPLYKMEDSGSK